MILLKKRFIVMIVINKYLLRFLIKVCIKIVFIIKLSILTFKENMT